MRIRIRHISTYTYASPARSVMQVLRLTPRNHEGQHVIDWRIEIDANCLLKRSEDAFANVVHTFFANGPHTELVVSAEGEVETFDTSGFVRNAIERFPPGLYLRQSPMAVASDPICDFASKITGGSPLEKMHTLLDSLHDELEFDTDPTHPVTNAGDAFVAKRAVAQDFAHIFIACARELNIPARYVSGHIMARETGETRQAAHAWAETYIDGYGWIGFDPAYGRCPEAAHIRVACALDYLGAAPMRGAQTGGGGEALDVHISVTDGLNQ